MIAWLLGRAVSSFFTFSSKKVGIVQGVGTAESVASHYYRRRKLEAINGF